MVSLCELGELFVRGKISTIEEHQFSAFVEKILFVIESSGSPILNAKTNVIVVEKMEQACGLQEKKDGP